MITTNNHGHSSIQPALDWIDFSRPYEDIRFHKAEGIAKITINRPELRNAFRPRTVKEMIAALTDAHLDDEIGVIIFTGQGDRAFCSGGDQRVRGNSGYQDEMGTAHLNVLQLQKLIRSCLKPVIAMVAGYAIGGGACAASGL